MLARLRKSTEEKDQGFTLIELLVVIIIIGILAAIAIPVFLNQREKGVDASIKSDLKNAATVAATYTVDNPTVTDPFTKAILEAEDWKHDAATVFTITGSPADGDFCISGHNPGASAEDASKQWLYDESAGGLRATKGAGC